jgi:hypothetical protein
MRLIKLPKQCNYPKKVYFRDEIYSVKFKKNFHCYGETDPMRKVITIKSGMSERETLATLVHELLHVIEFESPLKIKHKTVYKLERAMVEILLDNFL